MIATRAIPVQGIVRAFWIVCAVIAIGAAGAVGSFIGIASWVLYALVSGPG